MADTKITALTAITSITPATFPLPIVDLLDTTMAGSGTTKKVTVNQILGCGGTATLASATITGDLTVDTSTLKVDSANNRVGIGTASPNNTLTVRGSQDAGIEVNSADSNASRIITAYDPANTRFYINSTSSGSGTVLPLDFLIGNSAQHRIAASGVFTWYDGAGGTRMTLNSTGLGVGESPVSGQKLTVNGAGSIRNANKFYLWDSGNATAHGIYNSGDNLTFIKNNGTASMTLDASGNLSLDSGYVRAAARTQIGAGYIGDINIAGNNRGLFFGSTGLLPANGTGTVSDNSYNLGSGTERWATVYAGTGTINTSDRNEKQDIADLSASEKRVASSIKQLVKKYRFKDAVASKGENARIHVGWIAQDVQSAFAAEGLDASDYGMFCSDSWYEVNGSSVDSDGKPYTSESENAVAKTRLGLRHDELLAFVVSSL
jgi:hypothetical protein